MTLLPKRYTHKGKNVVLRKIRKGRVKINGYWFSPNGIPVPPILEGKNCAFCLYWTGRQMENFVSLWGSEEMYKSVCYESFEKASMDWYKTSTDNDGFPNWAWWNSE